MSIAGEPIPGASPIEVIKPNQILEGVGIATALAPQAVKDHDQAGKRQTALGILEARAEVKNSETERQNGYNIDQIKYIEEHYGLKIDKSNVLISRSQVTDNIPTAKRSCSLLTPGQNSFYLPTGYLFELPTSEIPWVSDRDAGTPMTSNDIAKPEGSYDVSTYLNLASHQGKYSETIIDFGSGKPEKIKAIFDFREIPKIPTKADRITHPNKTKEVNSERNYIETTRKDWESKAIELGVPFITEVPDNEIVEEIRKQYNRVMVNEAHM